MYTGFEAYQGNLPVISRIDLQELYRNLFRGPSDQPPRTFSKLQNEL